MRTDDLAVAVEEEVDLDREQPAEAREGQEGASEYKETESEPGKQRPQQPYQLPLC
jgi:hypothetical protein